MKALEDYNILVKDSSGKIAKGFELMNEADARALSKNTKK